MPKTIKDLSLLALITFAISLALWLPFIFHLHSFYNLDFSAGFNAIFRNYDGLEYVIVAKTFYNPHLIAQLPQLQPAIYYASHFPLYPMLILSLAGILGYLKSMLTISLLFTVFSVWAFYYLVRDFKLTTQPVWLSVVFLVLPARWVIVHSVGSPEPVFIFFTIATLYFFLLFERLQKLRFIFLSGICGLLTVLTRSPGILIFLALGLYLLWKEFIQIKPTNLRKSILNLFNYLPLLLIPLGLLIVFIIYSLTFHDFFAYFHSGDNIHLVFPPFQVFDKHQYWVGDIWLEDIVYIFALGFLGGLLLIKQKLPSLAFFVLTYLAASTLIVHRDVSRYTLPVVPFVLIAFEKILTSKEFKIVLIIIALGIYLYAENFMIENTAPIANLSLFN